MDYKEAVEYLFAQLPMFHRIGAAAYKADLGNITALCAALDNPQDAFPSVHIAGTNGKGSVSSMTASILMEAGYKVGLFTSPHLRSFTERIRLNGQPISEAAVADFVTQNHALLQKLQPSFFEVTTAMAFQYFKDEQVDIAVIEVGMGGRLDSTNIIQRSLVTCVTNISLDHTQFLGDTLAKIAGEKAGIVKSGVPLIIGEVLPETRAVFEAAAMGKGSALIFAEEEIVSKRISGDLKAQVFEVQAKNDRFWPEMDCDLPGSYQAKNIRPVLAIIFELESQGWHIGESAISAGIAHAARNSGLMGRMSLLRDRPAVIADIGHNEAGIREVLLHISQIHFARLHIVWGMVEDKDIAKALSILPKDAQYYFVKPDLPRGLSLDLLVPGAKAAGLAGEGWPSVMAGYEAALKAASEDDLIYVGGSTFVVAEVV